MRTDEPLKRLILGTAGHIDHGKTTLIKVLSGIDTDRLKEEKERGMSIELGFAYMDLPCRIRLGIVDVPGHERFVKTMVAGAQGIDLVMFTVAADDGVMPQTIEHLEICELLGVKDGIVVITKKDLVDNDYLELVKEEVLELISDTFLKDAKIIPFSAITGEGKEEIIKALCEVCESIEEKKRDWFFRLPIDRVFTMKGFGTVVTGTAVSGKIEIGEDVEIMPQKRLAKVRRIQVHGEDRKIAFCGERIALNLSGVEKDKIERGDILSHPDVLLPSFIIDAELKISASAKKPISKGELIRLHIGTKMALARVFPIDSKNMEPGSSHLVRLKLKDPICAVSQERFIIRSYSPVYTIGGGFVIDPIPHERKITKVPKDFLYRIRDANVSEKISLFVNQAKGLGIDRRELALKTGLSWEKLNEFLGNLDNLFLIKDRVFSKESLSEIKEKVLHYLKDYHKSRPDVEGLTKKVLSEALKDTDEKVLEKAVAELIEEKRLVVSGETLKLPSHKISISERDLKLKEEIMSILKKTYLMPPNLKRLSQFIDSDVKKVEFLLKILVKEGRVKKVSPELYYDKDVLDKVWEKVVEIIKEKGYIHIQDMKQTFSLSRKYALSILDYFDREKLTIRVGDKRFLRIDK